MEYALHLPGENDLEYFLKDEMADRERLAGKDVAYDRLYFGDETCLHKLPGKKALKNALALADRFHLSFSLVTPPITTNLFPKIDELIEECLSYQRELQRGPQKEHQMDLEIVVNDWGVLRHVGKKYPDIDIDLGRLLVKLMAGPRITNMLDKLPKAAIDHYRTSNIAMPAYRAFMEERGVKRLELNNLVQGLELDLPPSSPFECSLYMPYVYITASRICLINSYTNDIFAMRDSYHPCPGPCMSASFFMRNENIPFPLIYKGNATYYKNDKRPETEVLERNNITRQVHQYFSILEKEDATEEDIGMLRL